MQENLYDLEDNQMEIENRIRNLMWTVSGNYDLNTRLDLESFSRSKYISLYDAIKQGAFAKYYDTNALSMYIVKKSFYGVEEPVLMNIAQLCVDMAVYQKIVSELPGVCNILFFARPEAGVAFSAAIFPLAPEAHGRSDDFVSRVFQQK